MEAHEETAEERHVDALQWIHACGGVEVMEHASRLAVDLQGDTAVDKCRLVAVPIGIAGRGEIGDSARFHGIHGLGDDTVLEHRFLEVYYVVHDHVGSRTGQGQDAVGEVDLGAIGGMECHLGARRHVVDELHHPAAFVGAAGVVGQDVYARRKITAGHVCRIAAVAAGVEAVREHANRYAAAVDAELGAGQVGVHGRIALAVGCPYVGPRPQGCGGKLKAIQFGQLVDRLQRKPARDAGTPGGTFLETERFQIGQ